MGANERIRPAAVGPIAQSKLLQDRKLRLMKTDICTNFLVELSRETNQEWDKAGLEIWERKRGRGGGGGGGVLLLASCGIGNEETGPVTSSFSGQIALRLPRDTED